MGRERDRGRGRWCVVRQGWAKKRGGDIKNVGFWAGVGLGLPPAARAAAHLSSIGPKYVRPPMYRHGAAR